VNEKQGACAMVSTAMAWCLFALVHYILYKRKGNNMQKIFSVIVFGFLFVSISSVHAEAVKRQVSSFSELKEMVEKIDEPTATLVVMDDDDTLTMMSCPDEDKPNSCQYLGGPAWYAWQSKLVGKDSVYSVAKTKQELFDISALLLAMNNMEYTELDVPVVLRDFTKTGVRLMVETARGNSDLSATERQFTQLKVASSPYHSFLEMVGANSLVFAPDNLASLPGPFSPCHIPGTRVVSFQQGVMYVSGQNKGTMLKCLLTRYQSNNAGGLPVKHIVFIDDTQDNVDDVYSAFKHNTQFNVTALHYRALDKHKEALTEGRKKNTLQQNAKRRWNAIHTTIHKELLDPAAVKQH
jgi:hypothetical protein